MILSIGFNIAWAVILANLAIRERREGLKGWALAHAAMATMILSMAVALGIIHFTR